MKWLELITTAAVAVAAAAVVVVDCWVRIHSLRSRSMALFPREKKIKIGGKRDEHVASS